LYSSEAWEGTRHQDHISIRPGPIGCHSRMVQKRTPGSPGTRLKGWIRKDRFGNTEPTAVRVRENTSSCAGLRLSCRPATRSAG
jgi:hypothetical protein